MRYNSKMLSATSVPTLLLFATLLTGCASEENEVEITAAELPPAVTQAVMTAYPGAILGEVEREEMDGKTIYEVELTHDENEIELKVSSDGTILESDVE